MPGNNEVVLANPLDSGADGHSVESAAADFTRMLEDEEKPRRSEPARNTRSRRSEPDPEDNSGEDAPDPDEEDNGQRSREPSDDILDHAADDSDGDGDQDDAEDPDEDDAEDGDDDAEADDEDEDIDWDREVSIDLGNGAERLSLSDLRDGFLRETDYRRKTANLAEERREVVEFANETVAERKNYQERLQDFLDLSASLEPTPEDMAKIKASDPNLYISVRDQWDAISKHRENAKAELAKVEEAQARDEQRKYRDWVRSENEKLVQKLPALHDPKKLKNFSRTIMNYGKSAGYSQQELAANAVDHRDVMTLYKAAKYDEIMQSRKAGQRQAQPGPKKSSSSQPRNISKNSSNKRQLRNADRRASRSGSVDDAAMAFTEMLKS